MKALLKRWRASRFLWLGFLTEKKQAFGCEARPIIAAVRQPSITMFLIDDLLLAPVNGFKFILGQIQKMADQELNDDSVIKDQLLELQMRYELEEISDEDFREREAELFARLRVIKMRQLDLLHQATAHTAESSSFVIEVGGDDHE